MSDRRPAPEEVRQLADRAALGEQHAVARLLSTVERSLADAAAVLAAIDERARGARAIGFVGPPGVGKSSLVAAITVELAARDQRVAVLAYDPTGYDTRGAILGDRVRMIKLARDPRIFIRSAAARDPLRTLGATAYPAVEVLARLGFDYVLVEAVGAGQADIGTRHVADTTVLVLAPESGDDVQAMKSGVMEIADVYALNKSDLPGAREALRILKQSTAMSARADGGPPVVAVSTLEGTGIEELIRAFDLPVTRSFSPATASRELVEEFVAYEFARRLRSRLTYGPRISEKLARIETGSDLVAVSLDIVEAALSKLDD